MVPVEASALFNVSYDLDRQSYIITSVTLCWSIRVTWIQYGKRAHGHKYQEAGIFRGLLRDWAILTKCGVIGYTAMDN